jgi:hypothetical protein
VAISVRLGSADLPQVPRAERHMVNVEFPNDDSQMLNGSSFDIRAFVISLNHLGSAERISDDHNRPYAKL